MKQARAIARRFPDYGWAWPSGSLDHLLKAVLLVEDGTAEHLALQWLDDHDLNDASFAEQRLLAALAERHGTRLASHPAYPRLAGLQKMLWSRSRLTYREARPVLAALSDGGSPAMLIKGASRVAVDPAAQRGRVSHDIDILVRPHEMAATIDLLAAAGWKAATGAGPLYLKTRAHTLRALNFYKGSHGDIDLHQSAYHPSQASLDDDQALWRRAMEAWFDGVGVLVPSPSDRIALAIGHSSLDAHAHSDWLVDIDNAVRRSDVDWSVLVDILRARRLIVPAAVCLSYLSRQIGTQVPEDALGEVIDQADRSGLISLAAILEAKPRRDFGLVAGLSRGVIKQIRLLRDTVQRQRSKDIVWRARAKRVKESGSGPGQKTVSRFRIPAEITRGQAVPVEITVRLIVPERGRRVEFELATETRHLARLRYRKLLGVRGVRSLCFKGSIELDHREAQLALEARPSRHFRSWDNPEDVARYGIVPFTLIDARIGNLQMCVAEPGL
jgi:hypothetical protein